MDFSAVLDNSLGEKGTFAPKLLLNPFYQVCQSPIIRHILSYSLKLISSHTGTRYRNQNLKKDFFLCEPFLFLAKICIKICLFLPKNTHFRGIPRLSLWNSTKMLGSPSPFCVVCREIIVATIFLLAKKREKHRSPKTQVADAEKPTE